MNEFRVIFKLITIVQAHPLLLEKMFDLWLTQNPEVSSGIIGFDFFNYLNRYEFFCDAIISLKSKITCLCRKRGVFAEWYSGVLYVQE